MDLHVVPIGKPEDVNLILGQAHFIKTVDDLHETLAQASPVLRFGVAFCESSGPRLIRRSGNDQELVELAVAAAREVAAGHCFVVLLREGFPISVLNEVKMVREVCHIYCATANPVEVVIAETEWMVAARSGPSPRRTSRLAGRCSATSATSSDAPHAAQMAWRSPRCHAPVPRL